jgi:perosamine synthetase
MEAYRQLEIEYAKHLQTSRCVSVNTGTAALHVALEALQLPTNSKVIVPDFTMYASGLAVYYARLTPVFVDCDEDLLIDLDKVEKAIDENTKVLMITHIYGRVVDMDRVMSIARKYNLRVIEDACEAQGAYWNNKPVGSFDIGCFSLYRNKIIHAEEGGIVASNDDKFMKMVNDMKSMSFGDTHDYYHKQIGFNYRMTNSQAQLALDSLKSMRQNLIAREDIKAIYNSLIDKKFQMKDNRQVCWVYDLTHPNADEVVKNLKKREINARHSFKPMTMQPLFREKVNKNSLFYSENVFYLHININKSLMDLQNECTTINEVLQECLHGGE